MSDPRKHRHVRSVEGNRLSYRCGCINEHIDPGVLRCVAKCEAHAAASRRMPRGLAYYETLGAVIAGTPQCARYLGELREALGPFPLASGEDPCALEVGGGCSMYASKILAAGYSYRGIEPDVWAAQWTASAFDVVVECTTLEKFACVPGGYDLVLAAHSLEHMDDAPGAIRRCADLLRPGGEFWVVIPDDSDPLNPDHKWAFSEKGLHLSIEAAGFEILRASVHRRVEHELFLYVRARKR